MNNELNFETYARFVDFLFEEIKHKWSNDRPQDFKVCDAEDEEYDKCNQASYKWYIRMCNGRIPSNIKKRIDDSVKFIYGQKEVVRRRKELYQTMLETDNIVMWCVENIAI